MENIAAMDTEELMHLALRATEKDEPEQAITYLKRLLDAVPDNANANYLLGALHAQIGMYDRAAAEISRAVELDPGLYAAHFQLGLLHLTSGRVNEAIAAWKALDALGDEHPFYLFKTGLIHLAQDEFEESVAYLKRGLAANTINPSLNNDMQKVLQEAEAALANGPKGDEPIDETQSEPQGEHHILLSSYQQDEDESPK
jgi:tetratricopeptide (TPR) repeat protein